MYLPAYNNNNNNNNNYYHLFFKLKLSVDTVKLTSCIFCRFATALLWIKIYNIPLHSNIGLYTRTASSKTTNCKRRTGFVAVFRPKYLGGKTPSCRSVSWSYQRAASGRLFISHDIKSLVSRGFSLNIIFWLVCAAEYKLSDTVQTKTASTETDGWFESRGCRRRLSIASIR